ncbi:MAG TPA: hypothetical protein PK677_16740 [Acidiphilium sp.]|nr:hypothetical protein [Acidiphilium sp.]
MEEDNMNVWRSVMFGMLIGAFIAVQGVARADPNAESPSPIGKIYLKGKMPSGKTVELEMKVNQKVMAQLNDDMAYHNKMAPVNTMMCELHVLHPHRGIVMLGCTPG